MNYSYPSQVNHPKTTRPCSASWPAVLLFLALALTNTPAQTYTILHTFTGAADGGRPGSAQLLLSGTTLYGTTLFGGTSNCGTVFKLNTDGTAYTVLKNFTGGDGSEPIDAAKI
jgi:uncharacterized repeat protein (TIGR03803 family)